MRGEWQLDLWLANCYFASHRLTISTYIIYKGCRGSPLAKGLPALNYHQRAQMTIRHAFSLNLVAVTKM
jgi:hypothetical protein